MGARRAAAAFTAGLFLIALIPVAQAQSVDEARQAKESADRLVTAAIANRDQVEAELLTALERYQDLSEQLSEVSSSLDRLRDRIAETGFELAVTSQETQARAIAAYMQAVSLPGAVVLGSTDLEGALVVQRSFGLIADEDQGLFNSLLVTERDLRSLQDRYLQEETQVRALRQEVEAQADHLEELFATADAAVAVAIAEARAADAAYRQALDEVERARAIAAERERRERRSTTTTIATGPTPTTDPGTPRTFRPAVERWRTLVASYFPGGMVDSALAVMDCESRGDPNAYNPYSGASGLFQFLPSTWAVVSPRAGFESASPFDPEANTASAWWLVSYYLNLGRPAWTAWNCQP
jgi:septal ring factor EnvC (AmiA/AmiB activator)